MSDDKELNDEKSRAHAADGDLAHEQPVPDQPVAPDPLNEVESRFDVAGAALGALDPHEEADLFTAASVDPAVSAELAAMEAVVSELARLAPTAPMNRGRSAGIRSRLVARAAGSSIARRKSSETALADAEPMAPKPIREARPTAPPPARRQTQAPPHAGPPSRRTPIHVIPFEPRRRLPTGRMVSGLALAAALLIAAFGIYSWRNRASTGAAETASALHDSSLEAEVAQLRISVAQKDSLIAALTGMHTRVIELTSYASAAPMARMFWDQNKQMFMMYASNVKPPAEGKVYQVWLIARGTTAPISVGTFMPDSTGSAVLAAKHPMAPGTLRRVAVTEEPEGGMPAPTGPVMFAGVGR